MLAETVREAARRFGSRSAVVAPAGWSLSFADLDRLSDETAAGLGHLGAAEGDVVALVLPATPEHFVAYAAAAKLGAVTAAVNGRLSAPERDAVLANVDPVVVLATHELAPPQAGAGGGGRATVLEVEPASSPDGVLASLRRRGAVPPTLASDPDRPVAIVHTSGTTGLPKGAVFASRQLQFITDTDVGPQWGGGGKGMPGPALAHLGPMTKLAGALRRGTTQHVFPTWSAAEALRRIGELEISVLGGVPAQIALMLREPGFDGYDLSSVRAIVMGGGPATPALVREARERFKAPVAVRYSCTEAGIGTGTAFDDPEEDALVSVGRAQKGVTVSIVGDGGAPVPEGEPGEVCLSSPAVMSGYWRNPEATAAAMVAGHGVRTGDLGWMDPAGRLHLSGRVAERYVRGGYNVEPMEVEAVLADHPDVAAVAIVGREDPVMGEVGVAVVVPARGRPAPTLESLRRFGSDRLARYKLPERVVIVDSLPLSAMEKVDRRALAQMVARA